MYNIPAVGYLLHNFPKSVFYEVLSLSEGVSGAKLELYILVAVQCTCDDVTLVRVSD